MLRNAAIIIVLFVLLILPAPAISAQPDTGNVPVNPGTASADVQSLLAQLPAVFARLRATNVPATKTEILSALPNSDMFIYVLDSSTAGKLGLSFLSGEASKKSTIIVQEYSMYRDEVSSAGKPYRLGLGLRMIVTVNENSGKIATLSIPAIAANVESRKMEATVRLQVIGLSGKAVTEATPMPSELTFTTLMQMYQGIDVIKKAIWDTNTAIAPQIIGVTGQLP